MNSYIFRVEGFPPTKTRLKSCLLYCNGFIFHIPITCHYRLLHLCLSLTATYFLKSQCSQFSAESAFKSESINLHN